MTDLDTNHSRATPNGTGPLVSVRDLKVRFQTGPVWHDLVHNTSFDIALGEIVALVGESGSGKTLTARAVMGLLRRNRRMKVEGNVQFDGKNLVEVPERVMRTIRGRDFGMIFQDPVAALDPVITVGDQVREAVKRRHSGSRSDIDTRVFDLLGQVGITDPKLRVKQYPHEISGGMCQRVLIAIALAGDPELLIADEPTTALDVTIQAQVLDLVKKLRDDRGMSVLLITHDMGVAAQTADRILVMYGGSVVEGGKTEEFFAHPYHPYSLGLVSAVPRADAPRVRRLPSIPGSVPEAAQRPQGCPFHPRCPLAIEVCVNEEPPLRQIENQIVACHRAEEVRAGTAVPWVAEAASV